MIVRAAVRADLDQVCAIYNHYVLHSPATFDVDPFPVRFWEELFDHHVARGPYDMLVAADDERVAGFAKTGDFRPRRAYDTSVQTSVYCAADALGRGLGTLLYSALFDRLNGAGFHRAYANITLPNDASVALHERFGFVHRGTLTEVGRKFDRYHDVATYEKALDQALSN